MEVASQTAGSNPDPARNEEYDLEHVLPLLGPDIISKTQVITVPILRGYFRK